MVPGQRLAERPAAEVDGRIDPVLGQRRAPDVHPAAVGPAVEARPPPLGRLEHPGQAPVAAREDAFEERQLGVVPAEGDPPPPELAPEECVARARLFERELPRPLEGRVRLRAEGRHARRDRQPPARRGGHPRGELRDADDVLLGLARQPDHEVELQRPPPEVCEQPRGLEQLLLPVLLLDHVAQPLRPGLGGEGEARLPDAPDLLEDTRRQRVDARRGQRDRDALGREPVHQLLEHGIHAAVIAGGEREQRHLLVARARQEPGGLLDDPLGVSLAQRAVDVPGLAEAAALHAAAHHLDARAVVHDAQVRHDRIRGGREPVEVDEHSLADPRASGIEGDDLGDRAVGVVARREEGGHVQAGDAGERAQERRAVAAVGEHRVADVADRLLAVAEQHAVQEGGQRLGVEGTRAAGDHHRMFGAALGGAQRDAPELEHGEEVRVGELVL